MTERPWLPAMREGFALRCPSCQKGAMMVSYLKTVDRCDVCGTELHHHQADDGPPYFTMMIVGHIVVPLLLIVEKVWHPALWIHFAAWIPLTLVLTFWLMPRVKGAIVALQWANRMHGFAARQQLDDATPKGGAGP